jgi:hypothetical protein
LADAATVIRPMIKSAVTGRVHALCVEALALLGEADPVRSASARRLTVSERTVENHVSHILSKLGRSSRAGIASWYATSGS